MKAKFIPTVPVFPDHRRLSLEDGGGSHDAAETAGREDTR
jgi:hypothetical protein